MEEALLKIEHLKKEYDGQTILKDVSVEVKKGEVIVIVGPSGCGKSTFLRCINGLEPIQGGTISLDGEAIDRNSKSITKIRQKIGMVFQSYDLFPHMTVLDNIVIAPVKVQKRKKEEVYKEARELLKKMGLSDKENAYPCQLSGGQQQRVSIARALALTPDILFFDEPTSALDPELTAEILKVIRELAMEHMTMVIVTHEMNFAREVADRILFMEDGVIVEDAPPEEFFEHPKNERIRQFIRKVEKR